VVSCTALKAIAQRSACHPILRDACHAPRVIGFGNGVLPHAHLPMSPAPADNSLIKPNKIRGAPPVGIGIG
jgi:hypothetical protein